MAINNTLFSDIYKSFLSKITDDMYMQLTPEDTYAILQQLLLSAIPKFEFPRQSLDYQLKEIQYEDEEGNPVIEKELGFVNELTKEEINIISTYMIVEWIGQQLASIENVRMKYSGSDFKFTSQANHMQKLLQMKKDYEREGFHLQRLYKRRIKDINGVYKSTFGNIMNTPSYSIIPEKEINSYRDSNYATLSQLKELKEYVDKLNPEFDTDSLIIKEAQDGD